MENYFVIYCSESSTYIEQVTKEELLKSITPNEDGDTDYGKPENITFLDSMPKDINWQEDNPNTILIIKGQVVVPKPKKIVTEYDI